MLFEYIGHFFLYSLSFILVHGNYTEWTEWSNCSLACGGNGTRHRTRNCSNPVPQYNGDDCVGDDIEYEECGRFPCPSKLWSLLNLVKANVTFYINILQRIEGKRVTCVEEGCLCCFTLNAKRGTEVIKVMQTRQHKS